MIPMEVDLYILILEKLIKENIDKLGHCRRAPNTIIPKSTHSNPDYY